jgi:hypothetical protein
MLTHLKIERFRGLNELSLTDASRVNLIVGRNDTGKTSLLEAIRLLLSGDPRHLRRTARNRIERRPTDLSQDYQLAFYQAHSDHPLLINGTVSGIALSAQAEIRDIQGEETLPFDLDSEGDAAEDVESLLQRGREIIVEVTADGQAKAIIRQPLQGRSTVALQSQRQFVGGSFPDVPPLVWLGTNRAEVWSHARRYSALYRSGGADILLNILKEIEPRLRSLVVLTMKRNELFPSIAVLEADLGFDQTLPLDSMGDGFSNIISILSAIGGAKGGLCLIDEVDNGIHYSLLSQVWRSVVSAADVYNSQVWATTHSYDCINAIYEALNDTPEALRVHRLERRTDGAVIIHTFDHAMLGRALESGLEVR